MDSYSIMLPALTLIYYNPSSQRRAIVLQHNRDIPKGTLMSLLKEARRTGGIPLELTKTLAQCASVAQTDNLTENAATPRMEHSP